MEDGGKLLVLLPYAVLEVIDDYDAGLDMIGSQVLVALDCHDAHDENGFGNALGKAMKAAIPLEGDLDIGVVGDETILLLHVGIVPGGAVNEILVEGLEEGRRTWSLEVAR